MNTDLKNDDYILFFRENPRLEILNHQSQQRQGKAGEDGFELDAESLAADLRQLSRVGDLLFLLAQLAQLARTSRREAHSGVVAPLEEARGGGAEQGEEGQAPPAAGANQQQHGQDHQPEGNGDQAADEAPAPFGRADVGDAHILGHGILNIVQVHVKSPIPF